MDNTRDQLKAIREKLAQAKARRTELQREQDDVKGKMKDVDFSASANDVINSAAFKEAEHIVAQLGENKDEIAHLENAESTLLRLVGESSDRTNPVTGLGEHTEQSIGWNGHRLLRESDAFNEAIQRGVFNSDAHFGTIGIGKVCTREELMPFLSPRAQAAIPTAPSGTIGTDQGAVVPDVRGIYPPALLNLDLLDLLPSGTTDSNIIQYVQVAAIPGYAAETAELTLKPQEGITFTDATAPVRTIAGWIKMARQAMDDIAGLATLINTLIPYDVRRRVINQILQGDGVGQNIRGIYNTSGIGAPASVAGDNVLDGILRALTTVVLSDGDPSFVALNPMSWLNIATMKAAGSGEYMLQEPAGVQAAYGNRTVWGLAVTQNRLIPQANPLVGDRMGATVLVREGVNIKTSDADQDDFVNNRVTVLGETRIAFPVWRPTAFAKAPLG